MELTNNRVAMMLKATTLFVSLFVLAACQPEPAPREKGPNSQSETSEPSTATPKRTEQPADQTATDRQSAPAMATVADESVTYFDRASALADRQLQTASERCAALTAHLQDDCITSAHSQHDGAIAAARIEHESRLAEAQQENDDAERR